MDADSKYWLKYCQGMVKTYQRTMKGDKDPYSIRHCLFRIAQYKTRIDWLKAGAKWPFTDYDFGFSLGDFNDESGVTAERAKHDGNSHSSG